MAEDSEDPREVAWHPRKARNLLGHVAAEQRMRQALHVLVPGMQYLQEGQRGLEALAHVGGSLSVVFGHACP